MAMLGIYVGFMLVLGGVFSVVDLLTGGILGALNSQSMAMILAGVATLAFARPILSLGWREVIRRAGGRTPGKVWAPLILLFVAGYPVVVQIALVTHFLLPMPRILEEVFNELLGIQDQAFAALVLLTVIAPLVEEFICRGWLMPALLVRWRPSRAIALSALVFGVMHLNPWQFFYALYLGAWLAWVYARTRSVWPCVAGHAVNNGLAWVMTIVAPEGAESGEPGAEPMTFLPWPVVIVALLALMACAAWFRRATAGISNSTPEARPRAEGS
jgi:membrane protease YdiL (CAAX protease family)